ncbi:hypothetical protein KM043_007756 [Ampulex compressa]|nr:hypothetical protein KM043_007756 [Ampulex compressa]
MQFFDEPCNYTLMRSGTILPWSVPSAQFCGLPVGVEMCSAQRKDDSSLVLKGERRAITAQERPSYELLTTEAYRCTSTKIHISFLKRQHNESALSRIYLTAVAYNHGSLNSG